MIDWRARGGELAEKRRNSIPQGDNLTSAVLQTASRPDSRCIPYPDSRRNPRPRRNKGYRGEVGVEEPR